MRLHFGEYIQDVNIYTYLDVSETWPSMLPIRPMIGDRIISKDGLELEVIIVTIRHRSVNVELHLPKGRFESIEAFNKWYRNDYIRKTS